MQAYQEEAAAARAAEGKAAADARASVAKWSRPSGASPAPAKAPAPAPAQKQDQAAGLAEAKQVISMLHRVIGLHTE